MNEAIRAMCAAIRAAEPQDARPFRDQVVRFQCAVCGRAVVEGKTEEVCGECAAAE